jgi:DNA-binding Lrp family transcriptional regulator
MNSPPLSGSATLDPLDRQLVRALQLDPRATFSTLADVLGTSEQTVARRYRGLRREGLVRVVGAIDPRALGQTDWLVRLRCRPNGALAVAEALARREDVSWLTVNSGGSEVLFALRSRTAAEREDLLVDRLPRSAPVLDAAAAVIIRRFVGNDPTDWRGLRGCLDRDQVTRLSATPPVAPRGPVTLEAGDSALLDLLIQDGRTSYATLARATGMTVSRVTRRVEALRASGVLYFDIDIAAAAIGPLTSAYLWFQLTPARLEAVGAELARHDEVQFAAAISGEDNLVAHAAAAGLDDLYHYLTTKIAAIDGVNRYTISPVLRRIKQAGTITKGDRLAGPKPAHPTSRADRPSRPSRSGRPDHRGPAESGATRGGAAGQA